MSSTNVANLLKRPADERAELAVAVWDAASAVPWEDIRRKLRDGT